MLLEKIKAIANSPRFWQLFLVGLVAGLQVPLPSNPWVQGLSIAVGIWFGGSVVVGTVDRAAEKLAGPLSKK